MRYKRKNTYDEDFGNILAIAGGFAILYILFDKLPLIIVSVVVGVLGIASPYIAHLISKAWMGIGKVLGTLSSTIILTVVFYLFLFPIAVFSRIFKTNKSIRLAKGTGSYYHTRNHTFVKDDLENTW